MYQKYRDQPGVIIPAPDIPLTGWEVITEGNHQEVAKKLPKVTHGKCRKGL